MTDNITVRNLTPKPLVITLVERQEFPKFITNLQPGGQGRSPWNITSNLTSFLSSTPKVDPRTQTLNQNPKIDAKNFTKANTDVRIGPFTTCESNITAPEHGSAGILRLTFDDETDEQWRIEIETTATATAHDSVIARLLVPVKSENPQNAFTALYFASTAFLTVYSRSSPESWMKTAPDSLFLSSLSIPGTHNSATHYKALPSVRCQAVSVPDQLARGIRFLDVRVQPNSPLPSNKKPEDDDTLNLVHGAFPIALSGGPHTFRSLLTVLRDFLHTHPSETLLLSLKREGTGPATDSRLANLLHTHYIAPAPELWFTENRIPRVGEVRGRIVLIRRFDITEEQHKLRPLDSWGLDAANWKHNTPFYTRGAICVQDFCEVLEATTIKKKIQICCEHLDRAGLVVVDRDGASIGQTSAGSTPPLHLSFLSASNFWKRECWPERIAEKVNPAILAFLCQRHRQNTLQDLQIQRDENQHQDTLSSGSGGVGVVICDWVGKNDDWNLVECILAMNERLLLQAGQAVVEQ